MSAPVGAYELEGLGQLRTRLDVAARRGLAQFVGRQNEMEQMRRALDLVRDSRGQLIAAMGEPGLGKSRLFYEFKILQRSECLVLEAFSVSHGKAYPYLPLIELLKSYFQISTQDDDYKKREKVGGKMLMLDRSLVDTTLPYLFSLLGVSEPNSSLRQMDPGIRRQRTFEAIKRLLLRESLNQPLLVVFEDLHWVDGETQAFLDLLIESVASARILLLVNYRPEYRHTWGNKTYYTQLRLDPLGREDAKDLVTALLGTNAAMTPLKRLILEKTEGNPFFIEEVIQTLAEEKVLAGDRGNYRLEGVATDLQIPPTVQVALAARIDRLAVEEKELLQTMAVIGRQFSLNLLKQVTEESEEKLHGWLSRLQAGEFVYEQPALLDLEYAFKHSLTQEVAYSSVLAERRRFFHERTGRAIEDIYRNRLSEHYSDLAHHYSHSGNAEKAVDYLRLAGEQAIQHSAHEDAISHLTTALEVLKTSPDSPERPQQELSLQIGLGVPLIATKGHGVQEVKEVYARIRELCLYVRDASHVSAALAGLLRFHLNQAELRTAREIGEQLVSLAESEKDPTLLLNARRMLGTTLSQMGEFVLAQTLIEESIGQAPYASLSHVIDPKVHSLAILSHLLWALGYREKAVAKVEEAGALAHKRSHPYTLAYVLRDRMLFHQYARETQAAQEWAEAVIELCSEQGMPFFLAFGTITRGWVLTKLGEFEAGLAQIHEGLAARAVTGNLLFRPYLLTLLGDALGTTGQTDEALNTLAEALYIVDQTGERRWESDLQRMQGQLLLQSRIQGKDAEAESCFRLAIHVARRQSAKSLELRAVTSLSQLLHQRGKTDEARQMLAEIYGWFTEGFDTYDLKEAKALLDELS